MYTLFLYEMAGTGSDVVQRVGGPPSMEKDAFERYVPTGRRVTNTLISVPAHAGLCHSEGSNGIRLTYEVEHYARPALVRPGVVLPEGIGVAVRYPKSSVEHPDVGIICVLDVGEDARGKH